MVFPQLGLQAFQFGASTPPQAPPGPKAQSRNSPPPVRRPGLDPGQVKGRHATTALVDLVPSSAGARSGRLAPCSTRLHPQPKHADTIDP